MTDRLDDPAVATAEEFAALIGIDWADQHHAVCLRPAIAPQLEHSRLEHTPEALAAWLAALRQRFGGRPVAICLEQKRGALVPALLEQPFVVLFPVNPQTLAKFRQAFATSGAKDDPPDAAWLLELLVKHRDRLRPWRPDEPTTRALAALVQARRKAVELRTQLANELRAALKDYFPQALELVGDDLTTTLAGDFLLRWPTLQAIQQARPSTLRTFYYGHHCRRADQITARLQLRAQAQALCTDWAIIEPAALTVQLLARQLRSLAGSILTFERRIAEVFSRHPDRFIFESLPGAGAALSPRLATAFGSNRQRYNAASSMQCYSGIAPVTKRSGNTSVVHSRWQRPRFVHQSFMEFAGCSIHYSEWAAAYYQQQRLAGKDHHVAVRALAFKWIRILWRLWQDRVPYDESRYLQALARHHSPLSKLIAERQNQQPISSLNN